jgi:hypothetical protein
MVFNATFNNISVILWQLLLLVEDTGVPGKTTDLTQVSDNNVVHKTSLIPTLFIEVSVPSLESE